MTDTVGHCRTMSGNAGLDTGLDTGIDTGLDDGLDADNADNAGLDAENVGQ